MKYFEKTAGLPRALKKGFQVSKSYSEMVAPALEASRNPKAKEILKVMYDKHDLGTNLSKRIASSKFAPYEAYLKAFGKTGKIESLQLRRLLK